MGNEKINPKDFEKIGFVASGGSAKALFYHMGVMLALKERGIEFRPSANTDEKDRAYIDLAVGSSGGSIFCALATNGFSEKTVEEKLEKKELWSYIINPRKRNKGDLTGFSYSDIFMPNIPVNEQEVREIADRVTSILNEIKDRGAVEMGLERLGKKLLSFSDGLFRLERLGKYLEEVLEINDFSELQRKKGIELYITGTELENPRKALFGPKMSEWIETDEDDFYRDRYRNDVSVSKAVTASCAVPGLFKPVKINGIKYIDGETKKALSTHVASENGCDLIIVSHTFTPHLKMKGDDEEFGIFDIVHQAFQTMMYQKIQTPKQFFLLRKRTYEFLASDALKDKIGLSDEQHKMLVSEFEEHEKFDSNRKYIFIPSPPETFHLDYFNIFPSMLNELINTGYMTANMVLDMRGVEKLPEYKDTRILNNLGVGKKKFRLMKEYVEEKENFLDKYPWLM